MSKQYIFFPKSDTNKVLEKHIVRRTLTGIRHAREVAASLLEAYNGRFDRILICTVTVADTVHAPFKLGTNNE